MADEVNRFEVRFFTGNGASGVYFDEDAYRIFHDAREEARKIAYTDGLRAFVVDLQGAEPDRAIWRWDCESSAQRAMWCAEHARRTIQFQQRGGLYAPGSNHARTLSWANDWRTRTSRSESCAVCGSPTEHWPLGHEWDAPCCSAACAAKLAPNFIENIERVAVQDLIGRNWLPARARWSEFESLHFVLGETVPDEPLFRYAELPDGWRKEAAQDDHRIVYLLDERDIRRVIVFYQSAQYHRSASCKVIDVGREAADEAIDGMGEPALPEFWARMTTEERRAFVEVVEEAAGRKQNDPAPWAVHTRKRLAALLTLMNASDSQ